MRLVNLLKVFVQLPSFWSKYRGFWSIKSYGYNLIFRSTFQVLAKILDFHENLNGFGQNFEVFLAKVSYFFISLEKILLAQKPQKRSV